MSGTKGPRPQRLPRIEPMLATLASPEAVLDGDWSFETKWDGFRAVAEVADGHVTLRSRNGKDLTPSYPELAELGELLRGRTAVLDGEVVALGADGRSDFGRLQNHGGGTDRAHYMVFDVLYLDGRLLVNKPYVTRRAELESLGIDGAAVQVPPVLGSDPGAALATSRELHLEGVIAKRPDSVYQPGARARTWLKVKNQRMQEVVVVGWRPGSGNRANTVGSLLLAVNGPQGLTYVGRVGTGFNGRNLPQVERTLARLERATPAVDDVPRADAADARWTRPSAVGEVTFAEWTAVGRLRQPVWRGWRPDKDPQDVVRGDG